MKLLSRLFLMMLSLNVFSAKTFAQVGVGAANVVAHGIIALAGSSRREKQEKIIDQSITQEKISGSKVNVLRVKEADIKSKAKANIIALQNRLSQYNDQYKNNLPVDIPKNDSDLIAIQDKDENWPAEYYAGELKAYKRYAFQQKQKALVPPSDSLHTLPDSLANKNTTGSKL